MQKSQHVTEKSMTAPYLKRHKAKAILRRVLSVLSCIVVFMTTYAMILPAITMETSDGVFCGMEAHVHTDECYEIPGEPAHYEYNCVERAEGLYHVHMELCFDENGELVCPLEERIPTDDSCVCHQHDALCRRYVPAKEPKNLICDKSEHIHTEVCYHNSEEKVVEPVFAIKPAPTMLSAAAPMMLGATNEESGSDGISMSKLISATDDGIVIRLETYVTGAVVTTYEVQDADIILMLDDSGSMDDSITISNGSGGTTRTTKAAVMKSAAKDFVDKLAEYSREYQANYNIQLVTVADRGDTHLRNFTPVSSANINTIKNAIDNIAIGGGTYIDEAMTATKNLIMPKAGDEKQKYVIFFSDGNIGSDDDLFESDLAESAINTAKDMKDAGVIIYSVNYNSDCDVSIFDETHYTTTSIKTSVEMRNTYMNAISSNYPTATAVDNSRFYHGLFTDRVTTRDYQVTAGDAGKASSAYYLKADLTIFHNLSDVFVAIAEQVGGAAISVGEEAVMRDIMSDEFEIDINETNSRGVVIHTESYVGEDDWLSDENDWVIYQYNTPVKNDALGITVTVHQDPDDPTAKPTVEVVGFDYSANWVGVETTASGPVYHGKKIVTDIPILPNEGATSVEGQFVNTNDPNSGVFINDEPISEYKPPEVELPALVNITFTDLDDVITSLDGLGIDVISSDHLYDRTVFEEGYTDHLKLADHPEAIADHFSVADGGDKRFYAFTGSSITLSFNNVPVGAVVTVNGESQVVGDGGFVYQIDDIYGRNDIVISISSGAKLGLFVEVVGNDDTTLTFPVTVSYVLDDVTTQLGTVDVANKAETAKVFDKIPGGAVVTVSEGNYDGYYVSVRQGETTLTPYHSYTFTFYGDTELTFVNSVGGKLPSTGGIGTAIFYVIGFSMIVIAFAGFMILAVANKRKKHTV